MAIQWLGDRAYEVPMNAEPAGGVPPRTLPVPSTSDVAYVNDLADDFVEAEALDGYVLDGWTHPDDKPRWRDVLYCAASIGGLYVFFRALDALIRWRLR